MPDSELMVAQKAVLPLGIPASTTAVSVRIIDR